jgi:hypothetical protein
MPIVKSVTFSPDPVASGQLLEIEVTIRLFKEGNVRFTFTLDDSPPYFFMKDGNRVRSFDRKRSFNSIGNQTMRVRVPIEREGPPTLDTILTVDVAGGDARQDSLPSTLHFQ